MAIPYPIVRARRKTIQIRVDEQGSVTIRAPRRVPLREIERFVREKQDWIDALPPDRRRDRCLEAGGTHRTARPDSHLGHPHGRHLHGGENYVRRSTVGQLLGEKQHLLQLPRHASATRFAGIYRGARAGPHPGQKPQSGLLCRGRAVSARLQAAHCRPARVRAAKSHGLIGERQAVDLFEFQKRAARQVARRDQAAAVGIQIIAKGGKGFPHQMGALGAGHGARRALGR